MAFALDESWVDALVAAAAAVDPGLARSGVAEFTIGKTQQVAVEIADGRIVGVVADGEPDVSIPATAAQLQAFCAGEASMSQAYMRGDLKPVGSTGALLAVLALFDDPAFQAALPAAS